MSYQMDKALINFLSDAAFAAHHNAVDALDDLDHHFPDVYCNVGEALAAYTDGMHAQIDEEHRELKRSLRDQINLGSGLIVALKHPKLSPVHIWARLSIWYLARTGDTKLNTWPDLPAWSLYPTPRRNEEQTFTEHT